MTFYNLIDNDITKNKGYGVKVTKEKSFENISNDYMSIKNLISKCNKYQVDYEHFEDVLENYLEDNKTF